MLVKDEADIVATTVRHLLASGVDEVLVGENGSTDGTREILEALAAETGAVEVIPDDEVGYYQDRKTTALAQTAFARGHRWVVPCDADEIWHANDLRPIADFLGGLGPDVMIVDALVYNHLATDADDPGELDPVRRLGYRQRNHGMKKVACRLRPDLRIHMGNHDATTDGSAVRAGGLSVRHFSWRTPEQYCNPPEAPIWMADYSFRELGDVRVGDEVIGFGRAADRKKVAFLRSEVTAVHARRSPLVLVGFESGRSIHCSPDHLWLQHWYGRRDPNGTYKPPKVGRTLAHVIKPSFPVAGRDEWLAGWLAGIYDGEGYDRQIAQSSTHNPELYERICQALTHFEFPYTTSFDRIHLTGGRDAFVRFLNMVGPTRRSGPTAASLLGGAVGGRLSSPDKIVAVEPAGHGDVLGLTTTTGNYVAWGYASKNCRKIRNGAAAYAATNLPATYGVGWRMMEDKTDAELVSHFHDWFFIRDPGSDATLIHDPAPLLPVREA